MQYNDTNISVNGLYDTRLCGYNTV